MARPRLLRMGPPVRGLTDFPEHAEPEHSTQAKNVEFRFGGVRARSGSVMVRSAFYADSAAVNAPATIKMVKPFHPTYAPGASGGGYVVVGLVPLAGAEAFEERLILARIGDGQYPTGGGIYPTCSTQVHSPDVATVDYTAADRWDGCTFWPIRDTDPKFVACTSNVDLAVPSVHILGDVDYDPTAGVLLGAGFRQIYGINRTATPYNDGVTYFDDPGPYAAGPIRARFCRPHKNRLVLGNIGSQQLASAASDLSARVWVSNFGDARGWPIPNLVPVHDKDMTPLTGLGVWMGNVVVFRSGSIGLFRMDGLSPYYREVCTERGLASHSTIVEDVNGSTIFLGWDGVYAFSGSSELQYLSRPIERTLRQYMAQFPSAHATHYPKARQIWFGIHTGQSGAKADYANQAPDLVFVMDYNYNPPVWSTFEWKGGGADPRSQIGGFVTNQNGQAIYGFKTVAPIAPTTWRVNDYVQFDSGGTVDNSGGPPTRPSTYDCLWESGPFQYGMNEIQRWRYIRPMIRQSVGTATVGWRKDGLGYGQMLNDSQGQSLALNQNTSNLVGAFVLGTGRLAGAEDTSVRVDVFKGGTGRYGRVSVRSTCSSSGGQFDVRGLEIDEIDKLARR